jgi:hypothetical protein
VEFEPTIPVFKLQKTFPALNRLANIIGLDERFSIINFDILLCIGVIVIQLPSTKIIFIGNRPMYRTLRRIFGSKGAEVMRG